MDHAALRLLDGLRDPDRELESFAALLDGRRPENLSPTDRRRIARAAAEERIAAFARLYRAWGARPDRCAMRATGILAVESLVLLPRRDRTALALACVLGFTDHQIARVLGEPPAVVAVLLERAVEDVRAGETAGAA